MAVTANAIRVQLPGGSIYAPAMQEAAAKTGARSGLPKKTTTALTALVDAGVAVLNSGNSTMVSLEMQVHDDSIEAKLTGKGCKSPTKRLVKALETLAGKKAPEFATKATKTAFTITFTV